MRPTIRAHGGPKGGGKAPMPPSVRPGVPRAGAPPGKPDETSTAPSALKRKVDQVSSPAPGPRPKVANAGKGPANPPFPGPGGKPSPSPGGPKGKPMPVVASEKGDKGEKGGKGSSLPSPKGGLMQTPKAQPPAGKPPQTAVMPPKAKSGPEDKPDGPKPPDGHPPGYAAPEKRFPPGSKAKMPEPPLGGKYGPTPPKSVPPKGGKASGKPQGKGSEEPPTATPAPQAPKGKGGKPVEAKGATKDFADKFRLQNVEALTTRLMTEWSGLPEPSKVEGMSKILDACLAAAPSEVKQQVVDKLAAEGVVASGNGAAEEAPDPAEEDPTLAQSMEDFIQQVENAQTTDWSKAWTGLGVPREHETEVLSSLFEVAVQKSANDLVPKVVVELARTRKVQIPNLESAMKELAKNLEKLVETNDQAWHLVSYFLVYLFPRTRSSDWGLLFGGWNWQAWWKLTEEVLREAHKYRAFDILVLALQLMQEKSNSVIFKLPVFVEGGRAAQVKQALCSFGDMDEASILETLSANGVELEESR
mmetsp:Transcript_42301/g.78763  ORF Transcript_42301/g.78763 Transcript_42301/m.78763 type:complete len:531 (-) Transcript_42301:74-1666(-)